MGLLKTVWDGCLSSSRLYQKVIMERIQGIIQAPMAGVQDADLALAVSSAGGLGSLPCGMLSAEQLTVEMTKIKQQTDRPINVNFFCHTPPEPDSAVEARWQEALAPYYAEFGLDLADIPKKASRQPFSHDMADALEPFNPRIVSFHYGLPEKGLLERVKGWGSTILSTATTARFAGSSATRPPLRSTP